MTKTGASSLFLTLWPLNYVDSLYKYVLASKSSPFCAIILMPGPSFLQSKRWPLLLVLLCILLSCSYTGLTEFRTAKQVAVPFGVLCGKVLDLTSVSKRLVEKQVTVSVLVLCVKVLDLTSVSKNWLQQLVTVPFWYCVWKCWIWPASPKTGYTYRNKWLCLSGIVCEGAGPDQHHRKLVTSVSGCVFLVLCVKVLDLTDINENWLRRVARRAMGDISRQSAAKQFGVGTVSGV